MKFRVLFALTIVLALIVIGGRAFTEPDSAGLALAEFSVQNLSCGSCVSNIQKALSGVNGIGDVQVSVTAGRAKVEFDPGRSEAGEIGGLITAAGYPAAVAQTLTAEEYRALAEDQSRLAKRFVGRVGDSLISRVDFAAALARRETAGTAPENGLLKAIWQEIVQRQMLLAAAEANGVVVQDGEVDVEMERRGATAAYRAALREEMIIGRNIEEHVLAGESDRSRRRLLLERWYRDLAAATPVTIYDPALQAAVEGGGSGCGGSCCG